MTHHSAAVVLLQSAPKEKARTPSGGLETPRRSDHGAIVVLTFLLLYKLI